MSSHSLKSAFAVIKATAKKNSVEDEERPLENLIKKENADFMRNLKKKGQEKGRGMKSDEEKDEVPKDKADRKRVKKTPKPAAKKLKKGKRLDKTGEEEEYLDGDNVPLVEEIMKEMEDSVNVDNGDNKIDGDNFLGAVLKSNSDMMEKMSQKEVSGDYVKNSVPASGEDSNGSESSSSRCSKTDKDEVGLLVSLPNAKKNGRPTKLVGPRNRARVIQDECTKNEQVASKKRKRRSTVLDADSGELARGEEGSVQKGLKYFEWIISPASAMQFFDEIWEKRPLHNKRANKDYYKGLFSTKEFDTILREKQVLYGRNLDVTSYSIEEGRETHNPQGRANAPVVWDFYQNGCSLRLLNPQTFSPTVWRACATLQEYLGSMVGANVYLTPPGTQGFAPHFDDVEVFILQLEGKKHWRLYEPRNKNEALPRFSSPNFDPSEIGPPILDVILEPGDMLYMPRGTIHQGNCLEDAHSLHLTISWHQLNTFGDLLEKVVPAALQTALEEEKEFREGLPINYLSYMGASNSDKSSKARDAFMGKVETLMNKLFNFASIDAGCDQMGKRFMHDVLPPYLTPRERARTAEADGEKWNASKCRVVNRVEIDPNTEVRLLTAKCLRLVMEDEKMRIYHCVDNTREYHELEPQYLEIDVECAPAVEAFLDAYPRFIRAEDLPLDNLDEKMRIVQDLWERKLIMTRQPLESHYDD